MSGVGGVWVWGVGCGVWGWGVGVGWGEWVRGEGVPGWLGCMYQIKLNQTSEGHREILCSSPQKKVPRVKESSPGGWRGWG